MIILPKAVQRDDVDYGVDCYTEAQMRDAYKQGMQDATVKESLTPQQIDEAVTNWFADGWAQKAARGMLCDLGIGGEQ